MTLTLTPAAAAASSSEAHSAALPCGAIPTSAAYQPRLLAEPLLVSSGVSWQRMAPDVMPLESTWAACLLLDQDALVRLFTMWNALDELACDEISDWSFRADCKLSASDIHPAPRLLATSATVYANGEVAFALTVDDHASQLWFDETLDLGNFLVERRGIVQQGNSRGDQASEAPSHSSAG